MSDEFLENLYVLYHLVYFIIFTESIPKPAKEIIKIVSGTGSALVIRNIYLKNIEPVFVYMCFYTEYRGLWF